MVVFGGTLVIFEIAHRWNRDRIEFRFCSRTHQKLPLLNLNLTKPDCEYGNIPFTQLLWKCPVSLQTPFPRMLTSCQWIRSVGMYHAIPKFVTHSVSNRVSYSVQSRKTRGAGITRDLDHLKSVKNLHKRWDCRSNCLFVRSEEMTPTWKRNSFSPRQKKHIPDAKNRKESLCLLQVLWELGLCCTW